MCGRYAITAPAAALRDLFELEESIHHPVPNLAARYNVAPTQPIPVVHQSAAGKRVLSLMRWGLVPSWAKEIRDPPLINARSETVLEKPAFRNAFRRRRCLIPIDGFYEWGPAASGGRGEGKSDGGDNGGDKLGAPAKQPFYVAHPEGRVLACAGLWETWMDPDGGEVDTAAILTTAASDDLAAIHHRMPVILPRAQWTEWLETHESFVDGLLPMLSPAMDSPLRAVPVSKRVNSVRHDGPDLILPVELDGAEGGEEKTGTQAQQLTLL